MPRFNYIKKNFLSKDAFYKSFLVNLFISKILKNGKKNLATSLMYRTLNLLKRKGFNALKALEIAVKNVRPRSNIKELNKKTGTRTIIIPFELFKSIRVAVKWLISNALKRSKKPFFVNFSNELYDAIKKRGSTIRQNKEFSKYIFFKKNSFLKPSLDNIKKH